MTNVHGNRKVLFVVNVTEDEQADVSMIHMTIRESGVVADVAFALSDLEVYVERGECDVAVVDLSFDGVDEAVAAMVRGTTRPMVFASMTFFSSKRVAQPAWATRHIDYSSAQQFAQELAKLANEAPAP